MKKVFLVIICLCFINSSVYADYEMRYEELSENSDISYQSENTTNQITMTGATQYFVKINGSYFLSGDKFNTYKAALPINLSENHPSSADCIWTGEHYFVRVTDKDGMYLQAEKYASPLKLYDENENLIKEYNLQAEYKQHAESIGYRNGTYYCKLKSEWINPDITKPSRVIKSTDFEHWEVTEENVPLKFGKIMVKGNKILLPATETFLDVSYENKEELTFFYMLGDWLIYRDNSDNFYFSNDGIYFVKVNYPKDIAIADAETNKYVISSNNNKHQFYPLRCAYEDNDNIVIDLRRNGITRLTVEKTEIYKQLDEMKKSPYVVLNNNILAFESSPVIEDGSTLVPMRFLFEQMGAEVEWNGETQTATATLDNTAVTFAIDDTNAEVNNTPATMDVPARLINGKTMVPLLFLSEEMGFDVTWDAESRTAIIE